MKLLSVIVACCAICSSFCSSSKEEKSAEGRWRMNETPVYDVLIDEKKVFVSLDEFEKVLLAPLSHFEQMSPVRGFSQEISFETTSVVDGAQRRLLLAEKTAYGRDDKEGFHLSFTNDRNEGWDIIWKDGFLYKKLLGGEYVRTSSVGEHIFYKEMLFRAIPDLYVLLRDHATMSAVAEGGRRRVVLRFADTTFPRGDLPPKKYLQNAYGTEEMNNDRLIEKLAGKKIEKISGTIDAEVSENLIIRRLAVDLSFTMAEDAVSFVVRGERVLLDRSPLEVVTPPFVAEYHRRSFEAAKNIMEKGSSHEEK